jgi:ABC-type branched-subunit amino acid transport system ATPase component
LGQPKDGIVTAALEASNISKRFGGVRAVAGLDLRLDPGEVRGLIGPNGSGKSTTMHLISGYLSPDTGRIMLHGRPVGRIAVHRRAALGLGRTFQGPTGFPELTVLDNVLAGCHAVDRRGTRLADVFLRPASSRRVLLTQLERCEATLTLVGLEARAHDLAGHLTYAQQKVLDVARALVAEPRVLLMDEPLAGLGPAETMRLTAVVSDLRSRGCSVLLAEHNVAAVMDLSDRISVLNFGAKIAEGTPEEIQRHPEVLDAYLGREDGDAQG